MEVVGNMCQRKYYVAFILIRPVKHFMHYEDNSAVYKTTYYGNKAPYIVSYSLLYTCEANM